MGWGLCSWDIIHRSCQDHPKVTQGQNGKNNINLHFFAFLSSFSPADICAYYGLDPFPEYNYLLWALGQLLTTMVNIFRNFRMTSCQGQN